MSKKILNAKIMGPKAMEMVMRDVLGGMEDLAVMKSFESIHNVFEIVSISPVQNQTSTVISEQSLTNAKILPFKTA